MLWVYLLRIASNHQAVWGGSPPPPSFLLLRDGVSHLLLRDAVSKLMLGHQ